MVARVDEQISCVWPMAEFFTVSNNICTKNRIDLLKNPLEIMIGLLFNY